MTKKFIVTSYSGNVGKTTLARHLLLPRLLGAHLISVETINDDGSSDAAKIKGGQFDQLIQAMSVVDNVVVDVGSSNVERLLQEMKRYHGSQDDFDLFIIPCTEALKQQRDTVATIEALSGLGVPASRIKLVFNNVGHDTEIQHVFSGLFDYYTQRKTFAFDPALIVHSTDLFSKLRIEKIEIQDLLSDTTDYKALLAEVSSAKEKLQLSSRLALRRLSIGVNQELDQVYAALIG